MKLPRPRWPRWTRKAAALAVVVAFFAISYLGFWSALLMTVASFYALEDA